MNTISLNEEKTFPVFLHYLLPNLLSMLVVALYTFADTFVVGRSLGAAGLAAIGLSTPVLTVIFALGFLFGTGGGALYSIANAEQKNDLARLIYSTTFYMILLTGIAIAVIGNIFIEPLAGFLGANAENMLHAIQYLRWIMMLAPFLILDVAMTCFLRNDKKPKIAMIGTVTGSAANIVLDLLFVLVFGWGMVGAAIATGLGSVISCSISCPCAWLSKSNLRVQAFQIPFRTGYRIVKNGLSAFVLDASAAVVTFLFIHKTLQCYGNIGASAFTIIMNWNYICFLLLMGVAQSVQPLISMAYGIADYRRMNVFLRYSLVTSLLFGVFFLIGGYGFAEPLVSVFSNENRELTKLTIGCFHWYLPAYLFMGCGIAIGIYFQSIEFSMQSLAIMLGRGFFLPILFLWLFPVFCGNVGIWLVIPASELLNSAIAVAFKVRTRRDRAICMETSMDATVIRKVQLSTEKFPVLTISREYGSGGRDIGMEMAKTLGIPFYDKDVALLAAEALGIAPQTASAVEDKVAGTSQNMMFLSKLQQPLADKVFLAQSNVIRQLANKGACVIVGRCADSILHDRTNAIHVFIHAPISKRLETVMKRDKLTENEARRKIELLDTERRRYHDHYANMSWGTAENYDLTVNSVIGVTATSELIVDAIRIRERILEK